VPFIPVPNGVQLCFDFVTAGQNWQFCLNLRKSAGSPTPTDLSNITDIARDWLIDTLLPDLHEDTTARQVRATDVTVDGGTQDIRLVGEAGEVTGDPAANNACVVISQRTAKRGRSYRGRAYLSGMGGSLVNSATDISSGAASSYATDFAALQTELDTNGFDVVVASRQHNGVVTNPAATNEVIAFVVDTHLDSQRRRLFGRGT
jgi:hypothetical protein